MSLIGQLMQDSNLDGHFQQCSANPAQLMAAIEDLCRATVRVATLPYSPAALASDLDAAHDAVTDLRVLIGLPATPPPPPPPPGWEDITPGR